MKKRVQRIARASFYSALTLTIIAVTILLVTIGRGYFFDFRTGQLSGGGLILLDSEPANASVILDGKAINKNSPARLSLKAGSYDLRLEKADYRAWEKRLTVVPSEVTWAQYPFLLPNRIETKPLFNLAMPVVMRQSLNQNYLAIASGSTGQLQLLESGLSEPRAIFGLTPEQQAGGFSIQSIEWSRDNEHMLVGIGNGQQLSYVVISAVNPADNFELSKDFSLPLANLQFSAQNWREIYWLSPEGLRKLDLANRTVSAVLAADVTSYRVSVEAVFFIQNTADSTNIMRLERNNQTKLLVEKLPRNSYQLEHSAYGSHHYLGLLNKDTQQVWLYHNPLGSDGEMRKFEHLAVSSMVMSPDGRFLVMQNGRSFASWDSEFERLYRFELPFDNQASLTWFDPFHLLGRSNNDAVMFEFDGANIQPIASTLASQPAYSSRDNRLLYSIGLDPAGSPILQVSTLVPN